MSSPPPQNWPGSIDYSQNHWFYLKQVSGGWICFGSPHSSRFYLTSHLPSATNTVSIPPPWSCSYFPFYFPICPHDMFMASSDCILGPCVCLCACSDTQMFFFSLNRASQSSEGINLLFYLFFKKIFIFTLFYFTILYWFCHTLTWIHHGCTCVPKHEPPSHLPPHNISLGHPRAPAPSMLHAAWNILAIGFLHDSIHVSMPFSKSSHPLPLPQSPKVHSTHLCLFLLLLMFDLS